MASTASSRLLASGAAPVPGVPQSFSVSTSTTTPRTLNLSWSPPATSPPIPLTGYKIYRGGALIATQSGTSYIDTGLPGYNTTYNYQVFAYNVNGNSLTGASGSGTTAVACNNSTGNLTGSGTSTSTQSVTVPAGCFRVRIRALSGGGGGYYPYTYTHIGSCYGPYGGGGGGGYIDGTATVTPGSSLLMQAGGGGSPGSNGNLSGVAGLCAMNGGSAGVNSSTNPGGTVQAQPAGASVTDGGASSGQNSGAAALAGTNPTGISGLTHGGVRTQPCGRCDGCLGSAGNPYGGGGSAGTDSSALYGETAYQGGPGAAGYVVWGFSES